MVQHRIKPKPTYYHKKPAPVMLVDVPTTTRACLRCSEVFTSKNGARICADCNEKNRGASRRVGYGGAYHRHDQVNKG